MVSSDAEQSDCLRTSGNTPTIPRAIDSGTAVPPDLTRRNASVELIMRSIGLANLSPDLFSELVYITRCCPADRTACRRRVGTALPIKRFAGFVNLNSSVGWAGRSSRPIPDSQHSKDRRVCGHGNGVGTRFRVVGIIPRGLVTREGRLRTCFRS